MSRVSIIGAHHTAFGAFTKKDRETGELVESRSYYDLMWEAARGAITDAGLEAKDIDGVWVGTAFPEGFVDQAFPAPLALEIDPALRFVPTQRLEGACASSSVALYNALYAVETGRYKRVLVLGVEKMTSVNTKTMTDLLARASYWPEEGAEGLTAPGMFAAFAKGYQAEHKISDEDLRRVFAHVSALGYRNGAKNPLAHFGPGGLAERKGLLTAEAILALPEEGRGSNPLIVDPLRLHDCSLVSDGAAAVVLSADAPERSVRVAGIGHTTEVMRMSQRQQLHRHEAGVEAARRAYAEAGVTATDVEAAEVHDCFSINQILCTEALGLAEPGRAGFEYAEGRFTHEDRCAVNLSGGLKAKGHPVGATGVSMHAMLFKQMIGEGVGQAKATPPSVTATLNVGGSGVAHCVTVMRRGG